MTHTRDLPWRPCSLFVLIPHPTSLPAQSPRRAKRTQLWGIRKMQEVSKKLSFWAYMFLSWASLYFQFLRRVSKSKKLPYKLLRIFCTGFTGVSVSETLHYPSKRILTVPMTGLKPVSTIPFNAFGEWVFCIELHRPDSGKKTFTLQR